MVRSTLFDVLVHPAEACQGWKKGGMCKTPTKPRRLDKLEWHSGIGHTSRHTRLAQLRESETCHTFSCDEPVVDLHLPRGEFQSLTKYKGCVQSKTAVSVTWGGGRDECCGAAF